MEESNGLDLISDLPSDLLKRISSFLNLEEAVQTSLLSRRWTSLWLPRLLHFLPQSDDASPTSLLAICDFLCSYDCPDVWRLCFGVHGTIVAAKGVQKELRLEFVEGADERNKDFYHDLKMERAPPSSVPALARIGTLETLRLGSVFNVGEGFASSLLAHCESLRNLELANCRGLSSLEIDKQNYGLESLVIRDCPDLEGVAISAPRLRYFSYRGKLPGIRLDNTSSLVEVVLDLVGGTRGDPVNFDCEEIISLLASIKDVKVLAISGWLLEWLCSAGVIYKSLEFQFDRLKELRWIDDVMDRTKRDSLACFLNICPLLENLSVTVDKDRARVNVPLFHQHWHEPHLWRDYAAVKADVNEQKHLKSVELSGFTAGNKEELSLVELLHEKAIFLTSMTVTTAEGESLRAVKASKDQKSWWSLWKSWILGEVPSQPGSRLVCVADNQGI